ncbi:MAG: PadR family transcriptional regulator [Actinomycetota bacterium]|nr:PadR family transcriptional regulator [Actinomycetota bacterium]
MAPSAMTFVVLGLVAKRPGSGYDIAAFADRSVRHFWPLSRSQLYTELSRLEDLGWVSGITVEQDRYPNKRVHDITAAGMTALREWLEAGSGTQPQRTRDPMVLKTFLGSFMDPDRLADQLDDHRGQAAELRAKLLAVIGHLDSMETNSSRRFGRASARYGVLQAEATLAWIQEVQALLEAGQAPADPAETPAGRNARTVDALLDTEIIR